MVIGKMVLLFGVFIMSIEVAQCTKESVKNRMQYTWVTTTLEEFCDEIKKDLPEDTIGIGRGVPEIFFHIGRETRCVLTDWSDMNDENKTKAINTINRAEKPLFLFDELGYMIDYDKYTLLHSYTICDNKYNLYIPETYDQVSP